MTYQAHILNFTPFDGIRKGTRHVPLKAWRHSFSDREDISLDSLPFVAALLASEIR